MRRVSVALSVLAVTALALGGCKKTKKEGEDGTADPGGSPTPSRPLTAEDLAPVIREIGASGVVPKAVVFEFSTRVVDQGGFPMGDGSVVKITPDAPGFGEWTSPSTLTYTPRNGFQFGTKYTVTLEKIDTRTGTVSAPSPAAWSREFTTPEFAFVRASPASMDLTKNKVSVDLTFSGPVSASAVRDVVTFAVDGTSIGDAKMSSTQSPNVVRATLVSSRLSAKAKVRVKVKAGLAPEGKSQQRAAAGEDSFEIYEGEPVEIKTAVIKEGGNGFYVEVICNDESAEGGERYYWDHEAEQSWYVSRRCMVQESQAQEGIRFDPPVKFYTAPGSAGFRIFGDFKRGTYAMTIDAGVGSIDGGVTKAAYERSFSVSARKPAVSFSSNGRYLPRSAWRNLAINHLNLEQAELSIRHVPPENLVYWMSDDYRENTDDRTSNLAVTKTIALKGASDEMTTTWVDVGGWLPSDTKGVLELVLTGDGANRATARLLLTEMSIIAKKSAVNAKEPWREEIRVWAMGMEDSNLLSGVEVKAVRKSGFVVGKCTTSGESGCTIKTDRSDEDSNGAFALIATKGSDLTYLKYSDLKTDIAENDVQGVPWVSEQAYRAAIWSDRGVYRPGETAHLAATLRDREDKAPEAGLPVELKLVDPREKTVKKLVLKTNEAGVIANDVSFPAFADTGSWRVELTVAEKTVGAYGFNVEEFVPERMKVTASTSKPSGYSIDDSVPVGVDAKYLFGGSADGSKVEITCRLEPTTFKPKENANFSYGVWRDETEKAKAVTLGQVTGELDEKGHADIECPPLESGAGFLGAAKLVADVAVFEAGSGRSTNGVASAPVHPEAYYVGLSASGKAERGKPIHVQGVVVDWEGKLVTKDAPKTLEVELYRLESEYGYYWDEDEGGESYQRWLRPVRESASTVNVTGGKFTIDATPSEDNDGFIIRVLSGAARTDLQLAGTGRSWYWSYNERQVDQTPKPLKPTSLAVTVPKGAKVGEPISVSVKAPYRGKILFTAETKSVVADEWKKADAGEVTWSFKLKEFAPTVYVSAFLVKDPHIESKESFLPDRAFGVEPIAVEPTAYTQTVEMSVPESVRSNSKLEIKLDLGKVDPGTYATVAAVDEGILSLTKFKSPDPIAEIFAKRRLGVETFETVGWTMLLPPQKGPTRGTGGDAEGAGEAGRVQPVKPVALWSGLVKVPADGKLTVTFDVPQYRGALRVMAVTAGPKRLGRASKTVTVKDPIVLTTTLPRFVALDDEIQIPVFVTNLSGGKLDVDVTLTAENLPYPGLDQSADVGSPIQFLGKPQGKASLEDGKSATMVFHARAIKAIGAAKFRVTAKGGGHESKEELDVPFLPTGPKSRIVQRIPLEKGEKDVKALLSGWVPTSEKSTLWVTSNPYGESFDHLKYLLRYPYGCIEQTTSSTRPLLFVGNIIGNVDPTLVADGKIEDMVMHGVNRVLSMQTPGGGFAYWPGDTEPSDWGSAYATHMLLDAQKAGFSVPQDRLDDVIEWIEREATKYENEGRDDRYSYYGDAEAYMHYVLALSNKGRKARIQKLIDGLPPTSKEAEAERKYMLQAALYLAGDRRYEKDLKSPDLSPIKDTRYNSWSFYSDRRRRGFMLSTFQDLFGSDAQGEELAQTVARGLADHGSGWYTTQELVWGVTGLGKRVKDSAGDFSPPTLTANGKAIEAKANDKKSKSSDRTWALARASEYKSLSLNVPDKGKGNLYLLLSSEGVRTVPDFKVGGEGLKIHRTWRNVSGDSVNPDGLSLADLVYVEIDVTNTTGERVQNIALVDRLPAGFEIENPRLGRGQGTEWIDPDDKWNADYMNIRDDRVELFGALEPGETKTFVYAARVVTAGEFTIPPIEAEAMYDPRIWAREDGRKITINGPWKDFLL